MPAAPCYSRWDRLPRAARCVSHDTCLDIWARKGGTVPLNPVGYAGLVFSMGFQRRVLRIQVTLVGDLVTLCAAVAIIGYFEVGQRLRAWMPIFLYACPATGTSLCSRSGHISPHRHTLGAIGSATCLRAVFVTMLCAQALRHFCSR